MKLSRMLNLRTMAVLAFGSIVAVSTLGFAAANTVPATQAGDGTNAVSGFNITSVAYTLNATDPSKIDSVGFNIAPASAGTVKVKIDGAWHSCTNTAGAVTCGTAAPAATVAGAMSLQVVAAN
jgi:hypothetical protein